MKQFHFEHFRPVCPNCRKDGRGPSRLGIGSVSREAPGDILEGILVCTNLACQSEFPVIDGIPIIVSGLRTYVAQNILPLTARHDLTAPLESLLGDCCGPGSAYDTGRQHLSMYIYGHYGDLDPREPPDQAAGGILTTVDQGLAAAGEIRGPAIDLGCAVGRTTFALAQAVEGPVLGIDLNFGLVQAAARVLRQGLVCYPRRRVGLVYDRREFEVDLQGAEQVDFWICDAGALPLEGHQFGLATAFNLLDCTPSPLDFLQELVRILKPGGKAVLSSPYDWSAATPMETWLGGHSQRSPAGGASESMLHAVLSGNHPAGVPGLRLVAEMEQVPWNVRLHDRSVMQYQAHMVVAQAQ